MRARTNTAATRSATRTTTRRTSRSSAGRSKAGVQGKLRTRCYTVPDAKTRVFVELKKKYKGVRLQAARRHDAREGRAFVENGQRRPNESDPPRDRLVCEVSSHAAGHVCGLRPARAVGLTTVAAPDVRRNIRWRTRERTCRRHVGQKADRDGRYVLRS